MFVRLSCWPRRLIVRLQYVDAWLTSSASPVQSQDHWQIHFLDFLQIFLELSSQAATEGTPVSLICHWWLLPLIQVHGNWECHGDCRSGWYARHDLLLAEWVYGYTTLFSHVWIVHWKKQCCQAMQYNTHQSSCARSVCWSLINTSALPWGLAALVIQGHVERQGIISHLLVLDHDSAWPEDDSTHTSGSLGSTNEPNENGFVTGA